MASYGVYIKATADAYFVVSAGSKEEAMDQATKYLHDGNGNVDFNVTDIDATDGSDD